MTLSGEDITWELLPAARAKLGGLRKELGPHGYAAHREAFQDFLTAYFVAVSDCTKKQGKSISPIGQNTPGGKCFKVRWMWPGQGKSGGLRMAVSVYCDIRRVKISDLWAREDDPGDDEFAKAFSQVLKEPQ